VDFIDPQDPLADTIPIWSEEKSYVRGNMVNESDDPATKYVALINLPADPQRLTPSLDHELVFGDGNGWRKIEGNLTNRGTYSAATNYDEGDYVYSGNSTTVAGKIRFEFYKEANFLLLGIPTIL
jgi:hypothetical protein